MAEIKRMNVEVVGLICEEPNETVVKCLVKDAPPIGHEFGVLTLGDPTPSPTETDKEMIAAIRDKLSDAIMYDKFLAPPRSAYEFDLHDSVMLHYDEVSQEVLTRFLAEARRDVDVEKVWAVLDANYPTLRCGSCGSVNIDPTARGWCIGHDGPTTPCETVTITKDELADALEAAKGEGK